MKIPRLRKRGKSKPPKSLAKPAKKAVSIFFPHSAGSCIGLGCCQAGLAKPSLITNEQDVINEELATYATAPEKKRPSY